MHNGWHGELQDKRNIVVNKNRDTFKLLSLGAAVFSHNQNGFGEASERVTVDRSTVKPTAA